MNSSTSSTCVHDASLLSRRPRLAEIDRPDAQMPGNPASSTIFADRPLWASIRKVRNWELISARSAAALPRGRRSGARLRVVDPGGTPYMVGSRAVSPGPNRAQIHSGHSRGVQSGDGRFYRAQSQECRRNVKCDAAQQEGAVEQSERLQAAYARCRSAADLKFLHHLPQTRPGTSNRKAALES